MTSEAKKVAHQGILSVVRELACMKQERKRSEAENLEFEIETSRALLKQRIAASEEAGYGKPNFLEWRKAEQLGKEDARQIAERSPLYQDLTGLQERSIAAKASARANGR